MAMTDNLPNTEVKTIVNQMDWNKRFPSAIGVLYKPTPACFTMSDANTSHTRVYAEKEFINVVEDGRIIPEISLLSDNYKLKVAQACLAAEYQVRNQPLRYLVEFCEALMHDMDLPLKLCRTTIQLLVDFSFKDERSRILPRLKSDGILVNLAFVIPVQDMITSENKKAIYSAEELRAMQNRGMEAFSRMAVTLLQFKSDGSDAKVQLSAAGKGLYRFSLELRLSRIFLDFAVSKKELAAKCLVNFSKDSIQNKDKNKLIQMTDVDDTDINYIIMEWFKKINYENNRVMASAKNSEISYIVRDDDMTMNLSSCTSNERSNKPERFEKKHLSNFDKTVWY